MTLLVTDFFIRGYNGPGDPHLEQLLSFVKDYSVKINRNYPYILTVIKLQYNYVLLYYAKLAGNDALNSV